VAGLADRRSAGRRRRHVRRLESVRPGRRTADRRPFPQGLPPAGKHRRSDGRPRDGLRHRRQRHPALRPLALALDTDGRGRRPSSRTRCAARLPRHRVPRARPAPHRPGDGPRRPRRRHNRPHGSRARRRRPPQRQRPPALQPLLRGSADGRRRGRPPGQPLRRHSGHGPRGGPAHPRGPLRGRPAARRGSRPVPGRDASADDRRSRPRLRRIGLREHPQGPRRRRRAADRPAGPDRRPRLSPPGAHGGRPVAIRAGLPRPARLAPPRPRIGRRFAVRQRGRGRPSPTESAMAAERRVPRLSRRRPAPRTGRPPGALPVGHAATRPPLPRGRVDGRRRATPWRSRAAGRRKERGLRPQRFQRPRNSVGRRTPRPRTAAPRHRKRPGDGSEQRGLRRRGDRGPGRAEPPPRGPPAHAARVPRLLSREGRRTPEVPAAARRRPLLSRRPIRHRVDRPPANAAGQGPAGRHGLSRRRPDDPLGNRVPQPRPVAGVGRRGPGSVAGGPPRSTCRRCAAWRRCSSWRG